MDQQQFDSTGPAEYLSAGSLTPAMSSPGSVGPASPYAGNTSNPQVVGDPYNEYLSMASSFLPQDHNSKPLTPEHTPLQEQFLSPHYAFYNHNAQPPQHNRVAPSTPPASAERQKNGEAISSVGTWLNEYLQLYDDSAYWSAMPKLDRTMSVVYCDELYNPNIQFTSAAPTQTLVTSMLQNDVFTQRLQAANSQHLSASHRTPLSIPSRERSPFRQGSPLAPTPNSFGSKQQNVMFGTASHLKAGNDAWALIQRATSEHTAPKTISPKDVDLVYHETEADAKMPLFSQQQQQQQQPEPAHNYRVQEVNDVDNAASQQSYGNMATSRRESTSHASPQRQSSQKPSNFSNHLEDAAATLALMASSSSEYAPESDKRRRAAAADTGTYTCTYHGCTLRFETPAKLQRHKKEGHRKAGAWISTAGEDGMTSAAVRNTQEGPHRCERINPSTGKPCNTVFSRPYDLTRHEDTIHNARKQKVQCHLCITKKSFTRKDALTRHFRVCHPDHVDPSKSRRRGSR